MYSEILRYSHIAVLCDSEIRQRLFRYNKITGWSLYCRNSLFNFMEEIKLLNTAYVRRATHFIFHITLI